jgi:hypothetical protein
MSAARPAGKTTLRLLSPAESGPDVTVDRPDTDRPDTDRPDTDRPAIPRTSGRPEPALDRDRPELSARAQRPCRCGHQREAHRHYRNGTDCGTCGCERFSAAPGRLGTLVGAVLRRR